jgi:hypothetical protein
MQLVVCHPSEVDGERRATRPRRPRHTQFGPQPSRTAVTAEVCCWGACYGREGGDLPGHGRPDLTADKAQGLEHGDVSVACSDGGHQRVPERGRAEDGEE